MESYLLQINCRSSFEASVGLEIMAWTLLRISVEKVLSQRAASSKDRQEIT